MNHAHFHSAILAHHLIEADNKFYASIAVITLFVFGILFFKKVLRFPKGLIVSSLISYALLLFNLLYYFFRLHIPESMGNFFFATGIMPSFKIICYIGGIANRLFGEERLFESGWWVVFNWRGGTLCILSFILNTLIIFAVIRIVLHTKRKLSDKTS